MDRSHDINVEGGIFARSKKPDTDIVINVVGSPKLFQPMGKKVSGAIFPHPNKMFASIIVK